MSDASKRPEPTPEQMRALWDRVVAFVDKHELDCDESFCQRDKPQEDALDFVPEICGIVGYIVWDGET